MKAMLPLFNTNTMVSYVKAGRGSRMSMVNRTVDEPPLFLPVKLYVVAFMVADGVPYSVPLLALKNKPSGRSGVTDQLVTFPPRLATV